MKRGMSVLIILLLLCVPITTAMGEKTTMAVSQYTDPDKGFVRAFLQ